MVRFKNVLLLLGLWSSFLFVPNQICLAEVNSSQGRAQEILRLWTSTQKKQANKLLQQWMNDDKKNAEPWILAAQFCFEESRYKKCLAMAKEALNRSPNAADAYYWKARALQELKKPMEAANELQAAILAKTSKEDASDLLQSILDQMKDSTAEKN